MKDRLDVEARELQTELKSAMRRDVKLHEKIERLKMKLALNAARRRARGE